MFRRSFDYIKLLPQMGALKLGACKEHKALTRSKGGKPPFSVHRLYSHDHQYVSASLYMRPIPLTRYILAEFPQPQ